MKEPALPLLDNRDAGTKVEKALQKVDSQGEAVRLERSCNYHVRSTFEKPARTHLVTMGTSPSICKPETTSEIFLIFFDRRHDQEKVKLRYVPQESSFPMTLKCIDVVRTDKYDSACWDVHGDWELSELWSGFTQY